MNGAIGVGGVWNTGHRIFKNLNVELDATGYYQQAGEIWPFDSGYACMPVLPPISMISGENVVLDLRGFHLYVW